MKIFFKRIPIGIVSGVVLISILYLTLASKPIGVEFIPFFPGLDKIEHFIMFGALTFFLLIDYQRIGFPRQFKRSVAIAIVTMVAFIGGVIEILQESMGLGRESEVIDFIADALGAVAMYIVYDFFIVKYVRSILKQLKVKK